MARVPLASAGLTGRAARTGRVVRYRQLGVRVQHVNFDVLREDAERHVDRTGRTCGVKQCPENGLADLSSTFFGQR
jgi:hypothetical protein